MPQSTTIETRKIISKFIHLLEGHDNIALCAIDVEYEKSVTILITDIAQKSASQY